MEGLNPIAVESEIAEWLNKARRNPQVLVPHLEERLSTFKDKAWKKGDKWYNSREGNVPVQEAINYLKGLKPVGELKCSEGMTQAAKEHCHDMSSTGITGHSGTNGSTMAKRVEKYGKWKGGLSENLAYQQNTGLDFILYWVIDDGVTSRADRNNIFKPEFGVFGVAVGTHPKQKSCAVLVLGGQMAEGEIGREATLLQNEYDKAGFDKFGVEGQMFNYGDMQKALIKDYQGELKKELIPGAVSVAHEKSIVKDGDKEKTVITYFYTMGDGSIQTVVDEFDSILPNS